MCTLIRYLGFMFVFVVFSLLNCLVGCFSLIVWTPAVLSVLYICVCVCACVCFVFLYLPLFSAAEHVSHGKAL